jgi:hypothetical protein
LPESLGELVRDEVDQPMLPNEQYFPDADDVMPHDLAEFDFRYSHRVKLGVNDAMRADKALQGIRGKRLMYRRPDEA